MSLNIDQNEVNKFDQIASRWWDKDSEFKPLHDINPIRLSFIAQHAAVQGKTVLDVGCGGGILSEGLAAAGAQVTGLDASPAAIEVAKLHLYESGLKINYHCITAEEFAQSNAGTFDIITNMEMLEHVPDPMSVLQACHHMLKPGGLLFLSTINRNPKAYLQAILGAEYVLKMLPKGTHDYDKFIRPSELINCLRQLNMEALDLQGMQYNPFSRNYSLGKGVDVNYLLVARKI